MIKKYIMRVAAFFLAMLTVMLCGCEPRNNNESAPSSTKNVADGLAFSFPQSETVYSYNGTQQFRGSYDTASPLILNGECQKTFDDGIFVLEQSLEKGENIFTFENGSETKSFTVIYSTPLIVGTTPSEEEIEVDAGGAFTVTATAIFGCEVTAEFCGEKIQLLSEATAGEGAYCKYSGIIDVSESLIDTTEKLYITAESGGKTQTVTAATITVCDFEADVGETNEYITLAKSGKKSYYIRVVDKYAETFNGSTIDDYSRPTNSYLPKNTVDTCEPYRIYDSESGKKYYLLSSGLRVYSNKSVKLYKGNITTSTTVKSVGNSQKDNQFLIKLKLNKKTPFTVSLKPQEYGNTKTQDYSISKPTYKYVDVKFYKCTKTKGKPSVADSDIFKSCKWIKNKSGYTLRLYLKNKTVFYGYDSYYNAKGELVLSFLKKPTIIKTNDNEYGYSLKGLKIAIDAGHGGTDGGAANITGKGKCEKYYTLKYAKYLAKRLIKLGATVYMTRTDDSTVSLKKRFNKIASIHPDLAVSVHFNSSESSSPKGYFSGYYYPFTYNAAKAIGKSVLNGGTLKKHKGGTAWHYFNLSRCSVCPVVLTENGYLSNRSDYNKIKSDSFMKKHTESIVKGIVNYFVANGNVIKSSKKSNNSSSSKLSMASRIKVTSSTAVGSKKQ